MAENNKRNWIGIEKDDFEIYQQFTKETKYFNQNIELFTCATLIGIYIVGQPLPIKNRRDLIRLDMRTTNKNFTIVKCLAIAKENDVNILNNENKLYSYCENYANAGIKELYRWYTDKDYDFETKVSKVLLDFWRQVDLNSID